MCIVSSQPSLPLPLRLRENVIQLQSLPRAQGRLHLILGRIPADYIPERADPSCGLHLVRIVGSRESDPSKTLRPITASYLEDSVHDRYLERWNAHAPEGIPCRSAPRTGFGIAPTSQANLGEHGLTGRQYGDRSDFLRDRQRFLRGAFRRLELSGGCVDARQISEHHGLVESIVALAIEIKRLRKGGHGSLHVALELKSDSERIQPVGLTVFVPHLTRQLHAFFMVRSRLARRVLYHGVPHLTKIEDQGVLVSYLSRQLQCFADIFDRRGKVVLPHCDSSQLTQYARKKVRISGRPRLLESRHQDLPRSRVMPPDAFEVRA